jgi:hypothetical protein
MGYLGVPCFFKYFFILKYNKIIFFFIFKFYFLHQNNLKNI